MRIRVLAEETTYLECFVDVPEEIVKQSKERLSKRYLNKAIHKWIDENCGELNYQEYDTDFDWYTWEEVGEE